ncbi:TetR/AcrR family transcriptional regulator [Aliishimia ponticola]|uniref:TetR/AcrR family transcriptional regulator n=1 Tax=Aliishimia ponticola TaxID=2499833 RepID=A0A4S4NEP7_9RHOB|nr:TetR/AcrR family transcriptional regulator [Aliishimia ponticola]THH38014.1 TetR/AcrR family transcriptional regulator [Aliishimia ponticola]
MERHVDRPEQVVPEEDPQPPKPTAKPPSKHEARSAAMRARICDAATECLDQFGYAETTLNRIQGQAKVSRGALMYHFADRNEIIAATAVQLLDQSMRPIKARKTQARSTAIRDLLQDVWTRVVDTAGGRAMLEILVACRTDAALKAKLANELHDWDQTSLETIATLYQGAGADPDDAELLWSVARTFVRGLIVHEQFAGSPEFSMRMLMRFADLLEPHLTPRAAGDR